MTPFFELIHEDKQTGARAGVLHTAHGDVPTPCFIPVGTQASVKALDAQDMEALDAPMVLANTYHLHLRPGEDTIARLGGLHTFMGWNRPILTDSGGFQVFSLSSVIPGERNETRDPENTILDPGSRSAPPRLSGMTKGHGALVSIDDDGVTFRSHIDGSEHRFTPETAVDIQHKLGADIIMAFDECTPDNVNHTRAQEAMERTHKWAERSLATHQNTSLRAAPRGPSKRRPWRSNLPQHLFGIIQGAAFEDLRKTSAQFITSLPFDGIAIGGESIGFNMAETRKTLDYLAPLLPSNKPRYTMGVGYQPQDLYDVVARGADMFDCVSPTRMARNGTLFTSAETMHITNAEFKEDTRPIDPRCTCHTCKHYIRAYLNHLFHAQELSAYRLATIHNLHHFLTYMRKMREAILKDRFNVITSGQSNVIASSP